MAPQIPTHPDVALDLALALIASSDAPLLLLDSDLTIVAASRSFCRTFQIDPATVPGHKLAGLGGGEWNIPQLSALLRATASGYAEVQGYEMDLKREGRDNRCLVINAHKLDYTDGGNVRLVLAVSDITEARLAEKLKDDLLKDKDALLKDKAVLLQELQHRVANSLQIIASVLMQSARKVQSEETRTHLFDAHPCHVGRRLAATARGFGGGRSCVTTLSHRSLRKHRRIHDPRSQQIVAGRGRRRECHHRRCFGEFGLDRDRAGNQRAQARFSR